jgi:hypothetical protein
VATLVAVLTAARESGRGLRKSETGSDLTFSVPDSALAELVLSAITSKLWRIESIVQQWGNERPAKPRARRNHRASHAEPRLIWVRSSASAPRR